MPALRVDRLRIPNRRRHPSNTWIWREWCFWRVVLRHFRGRAAVMLLVILGGALAFYLLEPRTGRSLTRALHFTWLLIFGEPPEELPTHSVLLTFLFFALPVIGLVIVIEAIVDFALMLRDRRRAERSWCVTMAQSMSNHIVLVGLGRLGYRTFRLLRRLGEAVVVVESDAKNQFLDAVRHDGAPLLVADARRDDVLLEANIRRARSIIVATNDDLANLEVALDARRLAPKIRVILRMFDQSMADKVREGFNIRIAMSQAGLSAPSFAMAAVDASITNTFVVDDDLVIMQRWPVRQGGPLLGKTVGDVLSEYRFGVVKRQPKDGGAKLFPPPDTQLEDGDQLMVQGPFEALLALTERVGKLA